MLWRLSLQVYFLHLYIYFYLYFNIYNIYFLIFIFEKKEKFEKEMNLGVLLGFMASI